MECGKLESWIVYIFICLKFHTEIFYYAKGKERKTIKSLDLVAKVCFIIYTLHSFCCSSPSSDCELLSVLLVGRDTHESSR